MDKGPYSGVIETFIQRALWTLMCLTCLGCFGVSDLPVFDVEDAGSSVDLDAQSQATSVQDIDVDITDSHPVDANVDYGLASDRSPRVDEMMPQNTDAMSTHTDAMLQDADAMLQDADAMPPDVDAMLQDADAMPLDADAMLQDADAMLQDADAMPQDVDAMLPDADAMLQDADAMPLDADAMPSIEPDGSSDAGCLPSDEVCDGLDNNCSGQIDDDNVCLCEREMDPLFYICRAAVDWQRARLACAAFGDGLAVIKTDQENELALELIADLPELTGAWIGLNDIETEDRFVWFDMNPAQYRSWRGHQPDNSSDEDCVEVQAAGWNDFLCDAPRPFICRDTSRE